MKNEYGKAAHPGSASLEPHSPADCRQEDAANLQTDPANPLLACLGFGFDRWQAERAEHCRSSSPFSKRPSPRVYTRAFARSCKRHVCPRGISKISRTDAVPSFQYCSRIRVSALERRGSFIISYLSRQCYYKKPHIGMIRLRDATKKACAAIPLIALAITKGPIRALSANRKLSRNGLGGDQRRSPPKPTSGQCDRESFPAITSVLPVIRLRSATGSKQECQFATPGFCSVSGHLSGMSLSTFTPLTKDERPTRLSGSSQLPKGAPWSFHLGRNCRHYG